MVKNVLLLAALCIFLTTKAEVVRLCNIDSTNGPLNLAPFIQFFEDDKHAKTADELIVETSLFQSLAQFTPQQWRSSYWAKVEVENCSENELRLSLFFKNLTHVELYEFKNGVPAGTHLAGLFRIKKEITPGDHRDHFNLKVSKDESVTYLINVKHSKGYIPKLQFSIQEDNSYHKHKSRTENFNYLIFGAFVVFILFSFLTYLFTRFVPYLWLGVFTSGMAFYGFTMSGQLFDFFPNNPELVWRMNTFFTSVSGIGGFLLISMFFNLKKIKPVFHTLLLAFAGLEVLQFGASQLIIAIAHNYRVMTFFSIIVSACYIPVILFIPVKLWHRLTRPQRMFSTAIFIYSGLLFLGLILLAIWRENAISSVTYLNNISGVTAIVFFTIALGEQMRAVEVERNQILQEMNRLKNEQNTILEEVVEKRTLELREVNAVLVNQQEILSRRNERIELLLKELHHRVKNNLQLISSFYDLRRDDPAKKDMNVFLEEGKNRINVMSVVHNMLYHGNDSTTIDINSFIYMIASHLETLFNSNHLIEIRIVCADLNFDIDTAIPLGLIFNELVTNAYKHTQPDKSKILVQISIEQLTEHLFQLTITDNGKKIRKKIEPEKTQSFGIHMIFLLSKQLNGNFTYEYDGKNIFIVKFMDTEGRRQIP